MWEERRTGLRWGQVTGEEATTDRQIQRCSTAFLTSAPGTAIVPPEGEAEVEPPWEPGRCSPSKHGRLAGCHSHWAPRAQPQHCSSWCHLPCHRADHPWRPCGSQPPKDRQGDQGTHSSCLAPVQMPQSCCALSGGDAREVLAPTGMKAPRRSFTAVRGSRPVVGWWLLNRRGGLVLSPDYEHALPAGLLGPSLPSSERWPCTG